MALPFTAAVTRRLDEPSWPHFFSRQLRAGKAEIVSQEKRGSGDPAGSTRKANVWTWVEVC